MSKRRGGRSAVTIAVALVVLAAGGATGPVRADDDGRLSHADDDVRWSGTVTAPVCVDAGCRYDVVVDVPDSVFASGYALQVTVAAFYTFIKDLTLEVVTPSGKVFRSAGPFSITESLRLPPENGVYSVTVTSTYATRVTYEGLARLERGPAVPDGTRLLPNLIVGHPRSTEIRCQPEERAEGAERCLRFEQVIGNTGHGPFEARYDLAAPSGPAQGDVIQRVYHQGGGFDDRRADTYEYHPTHAHFHYSSFAQSRLWAIDTGGRKVGSEPIAVGKKNGFCMADSQLIDREARGSDPRRYSFEGCLVPNGASATSITTGIGVGWYDVYGTNVTHQYIEITSVPDGVYLLETVVDHGGTVEELNENDNCTASLVEIYTIGSVLLEPRRPCQ